MIKVRLQGKYELIELDTITQLFLQDGVIYLYGLYNGRPVKVVSIISKILITTDRLNENARD